MNDWLEAVIACLAPIFFCTISVTVFSNDLNLLNPLNWNVFGWTLVIIWVLFIIYNYEGEKEDEQEGI